MKELFLLMRERLLSKEPLVLITVVASSGSTPRDAGARMLVGKGPGQTGLRLWGSIGGGLVEHLAIEEAASLLRSRETQDREAQSCVPQHCASRRHFSKKYLLHANEAANLGFVCGGEISVFFRLLDAGEPGLEPGLIEVIEKAIACFAQQRAAWFIVGEPALGIALGEAPGYATGEAQSTAVGFAQEDRFLFSAGTGPENLIPLLKSEPVLFEEAGKLWFTEPVVTGNFVYVFGGGHVAQEVVPLLAHLGFRCVVFDDREEFAAARLFPDAEKTILGEFENIGKYIAVSGNDYIVIVTRGHLWDFEAWAFALGTQAAYIGVIGSNSKHAFVKERLLRERGFESAAINAPRVHAPVGIDIKSDTPAEIAVSIAAELILVRARQRESGGLPEGKPPEEKSSIEGISKSNQ